MKRALLVDLDDTLIENDLGRFLPAYFDRLASSLAVFGPKERILQAVLAGTRAMLENRDPQRSLARAFFESFGELTGADPLEIEPVIDRFYATDYPQLAELTRPKEGAAELLQRAGALGLEIVVATNPLMTRHAIEQRLGWAGIPLDRIAVAFVTDVATFHFAKPHLAYFAEVLSHLGLLPGETVMVGNDPEDDLAPALGLGIPAFHVSESPDPRFPGGSLGQARAWVEAQAGVSVSPVLDPRALTARLEGQLAGLLGKLEGDGMAATAEPADPGRLTPVQVVCHLRDVDREVNLPRLERFLTQDNPFFSAIDTHEWLTTRGYELEPIQAAVESMALSRRQVVDKLRGLDPHEWHRPAQHALLGPITLAEWVAVLAEHDLRHQAELNPRRRPTRQGEAE